MKKKAWQKVSTCLEQLSYQIIWNLFKDNYLAVIMKKINQKKKKPEEVIN